MQRRAKRHVRRLASLRTWWLVGLAGWLYGLPSVMNDGRWWWRTLGDTTPYSAAAVIGGTLLFALLAVATRPQIARRGRRVLRRLLV